MKFIKKKYQNSCFLVLEKCTFATALQQSSLKYIQERCRSGNGADC